MNEPEWLVKRGWRAQLEAKRPGLRGLGATSAPMKPEDIWLNNNNSTR